VYNIKNDHLKTEIKNNFNEINDLFLCQSENILDNKNVIYVCCDLSKLPLQCNSNNHIIVKYKDAVNYTFGFINDDCPSRNTINYIINQDSLLKNNESLIIEANNSILIHFADKITSLENFFNGEYDKNSQSIIYADLSNLDASSITSMSKTFIQCIAIEEINFINFDTPSLESMSETFSGCEQLKFLNLTDFKTSSVKAMKEIFNGCTSLKYRYIRF